MTEPRPGVTIAVTDHAVVRYLQRVRGTLDPKVEIATRVARGWAADAVSPGERGALDVRDRRMVFVCRHDVPGGELVVITVWEEGEQSAVPRRFTDALRQPPARTGRVRSARRNALDPN